MSAPPPPPLTSVQKRALTAAALGWGFDGLDGYLFIEPWGGIPGIETVGIILLGATSLEWHDVMSV